MNSFQKIKRKQENLREKQWNPVLRWKVIQETITWAESQKTVQRNTPAFCLKKQRRLLKSLRDCRGC